MTQEQLFAEILKGKPLILVEYRGCKPDTIKYRDKKSGNAVERVVAKHSVEMGDAQVMVTEWMDDGVKADAIKSPFSKGERCILELEGMEPMQGFFKAAGQLHSFEPAAKPVNAK